MASEIREVLDSSAFDFGPVAQTSSVTEEGQNTIDRDLEAEGPCFVRLQPGPVLPYQQDRECQGVLGPAAEVVAMNCRGADTNLAPPAAAVASPPEVAVHRTNCYLFDDLGEEGDASFPSDSAAACTEAGAGSPCGCPAGSSCTFVAARKAAAASVLDLAP